MTPSSSNLRAFNLANYLFGVLLTSLISGHLMASESQAQLGIHQVSSWHAPNDSQLIIKDHHQNRYQALLKSSCDGLENAKSIAFINNGKGKTRFTFALHCTD